MRNPKASPPTPQPKQWKMPRFGLTVKEGVFSLWKGQRPFQCSPARLRFTNWPTFSTMSRRERISSRICGEKPPAIRTARARPPSRRRRPREARPGDGSGSADGRRAAPRRRGAALPCLYRESRAPREDSEECIVQVLFEEIARLVSGAANELQLVWDGGGAGAGPLTVQPSPHGFAL